jgi:hypothetical protein
MRQFASKPLSVRLRAPIMALLLIVLLLVLEPAWRAMLMLGTAQYSVGMRNRQLDAKNTEWTSTSTLKIFTGAQPANCAAANSGSELVAMTLPATPLAAASSGQVTKSGTWSGVAGGSGTAGHYRVYKSTVTFDGTTCVEQGAVGSDMTLDNNVISSGITVTVTAYTCTAGNA